MKRWILALAVITMFLGLTACAVTQDDPLPQIAYDLAYDMNQYRYFSEIFDKKEAEEWDAMGNYSILLNGLSTPVLVDMNGKDVQSVRAYGQIADLGADGGLFQDGCPIEIRSVQGAVVVNISWDYSGKTFILTEDRCYLFEPEGDISTQIFVQTDGTLSYRRYWGEYVTSFEQWDSAPLDLCTGRDHFLYETGCAEIVNGDVILTPERTVTLSDEYDIDALFAEAKASGQYEAYETADDLFAASKAPKEKT